MTGYLAVDLILAVILLLFARAGAKKGLVLTLCSLIAVVVALLAASLAADLLTPLAVDMAAPKLTSRVEEKLTEQLPEGSVPSTEGLRERIDGLRLPEPIKDTLRETLARFREGTDNAIREVSAAMARSLAEVVLYFLLFVLAFVLALFLWTLLSRALNLVTKLPGLHFLNRLGGVLMGLLKGGLLLFIAAWAVDYLGIPVPEDMVEHTVILRWFMITNPLALLP